MVERWKYVLAFIVLSIVASDTMGSFIKVSRSSEHSDPLNNPFNLKGKLVFAHVIYRHGDRTPVDTYPTDPWGEVEYWPTGWGQLTNIGKLQHYHLGHWLKKRYGKLIKEKYDINDVYVRSTDVDRTLMSAQANLAGLYPPVDDQIWSQDILWQPIPVHTMPEKTDEVLAAAKPCQAFEYYRSALETTPEFQELYQRNAYLFQYITKHSGKTISSIKELSWFNNTLYIESLYNKRLPEWTEQIYPSSNMSYLSALAFGMETYTRKMARLKGGPLIKEMLDRFKEKAAGQLKPDRSLWIYSAHDTTLANVLGTLKLWKVHSPDYAATIMLEMRLHKDVPYISIFYKNNTVSEVEPSYIPNCGYACPLEKMYTLYEDILPVNWEKECKLSTLLLTYDEANFSTATGILICILLTTLVGAYLLMIYCRRRNYRSQWNYSPVA